MVAAGNPATFNESGDDMPLGFSVSTATPKLSTEQANIKFWDSPTQ